MTREQRLKISWSAVLACSRRHIALRNAIVGLLMCASLSLMLTRLFGHVHGGVDVIPLVFLIVIGLVARFLGTTSAIVGLLSSTFVFANYLFTPLNSLTVKDEAARTNLLLMLLFGLAIAYFYGGEDLPGGSGPPDSQS